MSGHSGMQQGGDPIVQQIYDWDDYVEDHDREQATRPFDAGIMLATAKLLDAWDTGREIMAVTERLRAAVKDLRDTAEAVVEGGFFDPKADHDSQDPGDPASVAFGSVGNPEASL